jgi:hypothetical protein
MVLKCSNPDCEKPFDYRRGRLFRFHNDQPDAQSPGNVCPCIRHFWLCDGCSGPHVLEYHYGLGVVIRQRVGFGPSGATVRPVCCCPKSSLSACLAE